MTARQELCATPVTLDGRRARISGAHKTVAMVRTVDGGRPLAYAWAWSTASRIVAAGGAFRS